MLKLYISALIFALILAYYPAPSLDEMRADADEIHKLLKQRDNTNGGIHSIANSFALRKSYSENKK